MNSLPFFSEPQANNSVSLDTLKVIFSFLLNQANFVNVKQFGLRNDSFCIILNILVAMIVCFLSVIS